MTATTMPMAQMPSEMSTPAQTTDQDFPCAVLVACAARGLSDRQQRHDALTLAAELFKCTLQKGCPSHARCNRALSELMASSLAD
ncbi:hypothetical protein [Telmatospirillum sp. J64-1]|uniref:hypothetical protein n=1 Tax=Telmatospirillum sp. J64-1 TaxID=2502183 RepID=UPI00115DE3A7|nr:hypothetical protein [Telmatospirillum sp. J64-1]